jgi:hypothetical protein
MLHGCVVMWLHILFLAGWRVYVARFGRFLTILRTVTLASRDDALPEVGVNVPKHVGAVVM